MSINVVVDLSHYNGKVDFKAAKADGIIGVITKASQGSGHRDPSLEAHRAGALDAGLLFGAYHFATGDDPVAQADYFLDAVGDDPSTLLVLDLEHNPSGSSMDLKGARAFVTHIEKKTGRFPGLYGGEYLKGLLGGAKDGVLANCWFWLAQYGSKAVVPANWPTWTMWQYTDGALGQPPYTVDGIGRCDRDKFNGTEEQLRKLWIG